MVTPRRTSNDSNRRPGLLAGASPSVMTEGLLTVLSTVVAMALVSITLLYIRYGQGLELIIARVAETGRHLPRLRQGDSLAGHPCTIMTDSRTRNQVTRPSHSGALRCETLFLDAGGVLVWPNWWRIADTLRAHSLEVSAEALAAADPQVRHELDLSTGMTALGDHRRGSRFFELLLARAGVAEPLSGGAHDALAVLRDYHATENLWEYVPDFVPPALAELRRKGLRLVVVSNANGTLLRAFTRLGLAPLVDVILDSAEFGVEKPDRRLFDTALERSGARRATTVHVGDLYTIDVVGARNAGLTGVLVDQAGLYPDADCPRIASIAELPGLVKLGGEGR